MVAVTTVKKISPTIIERNADCADILVMTTESPSMPATVTATQTRNTGHPDNRTNHSVQLTRFGPGRVCADSPNRVKPPC